MFKKIFVFCTVALLIMGCGGKKKAEVTGLKSGIDPEAFHVERDGKWINLYTLTNKAGMEVSITNFGGRIVSVMVPDKKGEYKDVVLGFDNIQDYFPENNQTDFGATIGRYANRINQGKITVEGVEYQLPQNNYGHCLHGGPNGWQYKVAEVVAGSGNTLKLKFDSPDGEANFPGHVTAYVTFTLPINDDVCRTYTTVTDGSGNFSLEAVQGAGVLTVSNPRYITWRGNTTLPLADPQATHVVLREITGPVVHYEMPFTESVMEGEVGNVLPVYNDMDNVDVQVYNLTTGQTLENISVQYPQIVLVEGASAGDHLRLTTTSRKNAFKPVETTTVLDSEGKGNATLPLTAWGGLSLKMEQTDNVAVTTNIYDANGQKLRTSYKASASVTAVPTDYCGNMIYENGVLKHCEKIT